MKLKALIRPEGRTLARLLSLCVLVGLVAGIGAVGFFYMLEAGRFFFMDYLAHYEPATAHREKPLLKVDEHGHVARVRGSATSAPDADPAPRPFRRWLLMILPAIGGLISGVIVFTLAPEAEGHGTDAAIEAYHFKGGIVRARVPLIKAVTSAITIGSGGSAGREGPTAQIGAGFGSVLAQMLGLSPQERRLLMATGMGAGIGAIFHAPLAGAIFAAEVPYRDLDIEHEVLLPGFIASIVAYAVFGSVFGFHPLFITPDYVFDRASLLLPFLILALVCSAGAMVYVRAFYGARRLFLDRLHLPNHIKPALGGLLVGIIGFLLPEALGTGYGVVQQCFDDNVGSLISAGAFIHLLPAGASSTTVAMFLLATIALAKIATTSLTVGSGGSGGVFGPAVVIGGALGGATGIFCQRLFPSIPVQPGAFALVGMAGFFAAAANTPISTIIMVSEMTGNYNLLVPSMLVCMLGFALCRRFTLYQKQLPSRLESPSHRVNMASAVLRQLTVGQALAGKKDSATVAVPENMPFREVMTRFSQSSQACLPVVDAQGRLTGVIDTMVIRRVIGKAGLNELVIAMDIAVPATTLRPSDSLLIAIDRMIDGHSDELVVVDGNNVRKIVGTLSRGDIVSAYDRYLLEEAS